MLVQVRYILGQTRYVTSSKFRLGQVILGYFMLGHFRPG
jgi:hypothetical protein